MKKKNQRKSNLSLLLLLLLLTAVLLVSSSYAWFTSNQTVTVSTLNVNVQAKNGLQISVDGTTWKSIISNDDIKGATATYTAAVNQIPTVMEPVSSIGEVDTTTGFMKMFYGEVNTEGANPRLIGTRSTETNGPVEGELTSVTNDRKFIAFDLFFQVATSTPVYLARTTSGVRTKTGVQSKGLEYASRVAFVVEGNVAPGGALTDIQALDGATDATVYIWEPNYDVHTAAGIDNARDYYGYTGVNALTRTGGSLLTYSGVKADFTLTENVLLTQANATSNTDYFGSVTADYFTPLAFSGESNAENANNYAIFTLSPGVTKVRIYMWIEGQDVDCENTASGSDIAYDLQITTQAT